MEDEKGPRGGQNPYILDQNKRRVSPSPLPLVAIYQVFVGIASIAGLVCTGHRFVFSNQYLSHFCHFLLVGAFYTSNLINTFGMAYNRQAFGIFFNRYWRGTSTLLMCLLNLPEFDRAERLFLDYACCVLICSSGVVFLMSFFVVERAENCVRDGGPYDYIGEYTPAY